MTRTSSPLSSRVRTGMLMLCVFIWVCGFTATHLPRKAVPPSGLSDKWLHTIGYFVLVAILVATLVTRELPRRRRMLFLLVAVPLYAAFDEISQPLVGRSANIYDWIMDLCGALLAIAAVESFLVLLRRRPRTGETK